MDSMNRKPEKRNDLQCWRAFSILAVLLFHIWPKITPNGFVGVDIFFIISGYFMAKLYFNRKTFGINCFGEFYFKRVKRITPVYFIITIFLIYLLPFSIHDVDYQLALKNFKWASVFLTNFQDKWTNLDYFSVTSQYHFFRHCWSLSVEMQFYLIFPLIALIQTKLPHHLFQLFLIILFLASLIFQHTRASPIDYYENTMSRLWQFMVGILAAQQQLEPNRHLCKLLFLIATALVFFPKELPQGIVSFISVITVALIISFSSSKYSPFDHLPYYSGLVYLGDISYALYLIHWPLISYMKYCTIDGGLNSFEGIIAGLSSITLAIIVHETIEKLLIKHCDNIHRLLYFIIFGYLISFVYIPWTVTDEVSTYSKITQKFITDVNNFSKPMELPPQWTSKNDIEFAHYIKKSHTFVGNVTKCDIEKHYFVTTGNAYTHYCEVESTLTGNLTAMVIGNSYAHNVLPVISSNQLLKKVTSMTAFGCLYVKDPKNQCIAYINAVNEAVPRIKPDIIYFIQGYVSITMGSTLRKKSTQTKWIENFKYAFDFFQQHASVIITNHQHFRFRAPVNAEYTRRKNLGYDIHMNEKKQPGITSLDKIQLSVPCSKCLWINYNDFFCRNDYCTPIDPYLRLPMFLDEDHVTIIGARRAQDLYENATKIATKMIKEYVLI